MRGDYVLLGAGFSRAISSSMPLLHELSFQVLDELRLDEDVLAPFEGNLEQWLSFLSADQPWLTEQENLRNRALFRDASKAVFSSIVRCESLAVASPPPSWLARIAWHWCEAQAGIATYNYDLLLERIVSQLSLTRTWSDLYGMPLTERHAPGTNSMFSTEQPPGSVLQLFKLHGSINWFYGGPDAPVSDRVVLTSSSDWWPGTPSDVTPSLPTGRQSALYDDLVPLIVPPTGTKGPYYGNRSLRAQWQRAFETLESADSLTIIGYSFPPSDLVSRHFLSNSRLAARVTVVDVRGDAASTVRKLLPAADVTLFCGDTAVADYVDSTCGDVVLWGVQHDAAGRRPRMQVNGIDVDLASSACPYLPESYPSDPDPASTWVREEVERRYPGITALAASNHWPRSNDGTLWQGAYADRRHRREL